MPEPLRLVRSSDRLIHEALTDFLLSRSAALRAPRTVEFYRETLKPFHEALVLAGIEDPARIEARHVRAFLSKVAARGAAPGTCHAYARAIRTWLRFLHREGYMERLVSFDLPRVPQQPPKVISIQDVRKLLEAADTDRDKALILFLLDTGARRAEAQALLWGDVNLQTGVVQLRHTKNGRHRMVLLGARSRRALLRYRRRVAHETTSPLWQGPQGRQLLDSGIRQIIRRLSARAGVRASPHDFRRTFASAAVSAGMNLVHLQALMGHADLGMLRRYVAATEEDLKASHASSGPVDRFLR
jgi:integrase/recombinase XerD